MLSHEGSISSSSMHPTASGFCIQKHPILEELPPGFGIKGALTANYINGRMERFLEMVTEPSEEKEVN